MHLKLDKLITKNVNGIALQIYATLIDVTESKQNPHTWSGVGGKKSEHCPP